MLAYLLRFTYLSQMTLGAWLGYWAEPLPSAWLSAGMGAVAVLLVIQAFVVLLGVLLACRSRYLAPAGGRSMLLPIFRLFFAELRAVLTVYLGRQVWSAHADGVVRMPERTGLNTARMPVLLVHGYLCNHRVWDDVSSNLQQQGHAVLVMDLLPLFVSIDHYVPDIEAAVQSLCKATGQSKVALVGHSMGGLAIRAWMRSHGTAQVRKVVTLGTPHQGTCLARFSITPNGKEMAWKSEWITALEASENAQTRALMTIGLSDLDNIVYPQREQVLQGCEVTEFKGLGHLELCLNPGVLTWLCSTLRDAVGPLHAQHAMSAEAQTSLPVVAAALARPQSLAELFWALSWISLQGFGGVLSVLQRELVDKKKWLTQTQFVEDWSVSQILPGPNVVNLALMMGDRYFGWRGGLVAMAGFMFFPWVLVLVLVVMFSGVSDVPAVQGALRGMGAVAAGMIAGQGLRLLGALRSNVLGIRLAYGVSFATFCAAAWLGAPLVWILICIGGFSSVSAYVMLKNLPHDSQP